MELMLTRCVCFNAIGPYLEFDEFLLVELSSVVLELVVIGPLREVACVPYMVLRWFYGEYCNL